MPELPEVECVRRTLARRIVGRRVVGVEVRRAAVARGKAMGRALLVGCVLEEPRRHGKHLALTTGDDGPCVAVHLGMTGSLYCEASAPADSCDKHVHVLWKLDDGSILSFRDPRRFGGVWTFATREAMEAQRWAPLGPDALTITPKSLACRFESRRGAIKAVLLDQTLIAGLGNIYADELLFACGMNPMMRACRLTIDDHKKLTTAMRRILRRAIDAGGSSVRDYVDGHGRAGRYQRRHQVYGRAGLPCTVCGSTLASNIIAGRTTVHCPRCQPLH
ncbi:MAG: bifunctional DNA-formamidopyrimidine glycosylase/DNA-(apurinic or apyrimidinic site) lyase [Phycisphaeraceae bacterium]|nr:bifunctional DNA-formamidopyrimidine glycosylase/DNA-(apurinic or apyrimidinic site) lyase [Phycisphaeraceae bacterium]